MHLKAVKLEKKSGDEEFILSNKKRKLLDFWRWAFSDLIGNTERGVVAEYLVAVACDLDDNVRIGWDTWDLTLGEIKIEVKSSVYLQTWKQNKFSDIIFNIPETISWDYRENKYGNTRKRHADVYVFALLAHKVKESLNPMDTTQWEFYVLNTKTIDRRLGSKKQINLKNVIAIGARKCAFNELKDAIIEKYKE